MEKVAGIDGRRWWVQADNMEAGAFPSLYIFLLNSFFEPLLAELHLLSNSLYHTSCQTVVGSNI
jgi:hypothetical protein